jgi:hypothetical protein
LATNKKPPGSVTVPVHIPPELHRQITTMAERGKTSEYIVECLEQTVPNRWEKWLNAEREKIELSRQNKKDPIRKKA